MRTIFTGHIGAGDDGYPLVGVVEGGVVGDEEHVLHGLLHHRMAALRDADGAGGVHLRHGVAVAHGHLGQRAQGVQPGHGLGAALHPLHLGGHAVAQLAEAAVLQLVDALAGGHEGVFQLLELRGEVALVGHQGLFADIVGGDVVLPGGFGYVDEVAEDLVIAHLQLFDAGALALARLQLGHQAGAVVAHVPQPVHLFAVAGAQDAALAHREGGIVADRLADARTDVAQRVHGGDLPQLQRRERREQLTQPRQRGAAQPQGPQIAPARRAVDDAADQALHIGDLPQGHGQLAPGDVVPVQLVHGGEAAFDGHRAQQRPLDPGAQHAPAHGGLGLVQHPQQRAALFAAAQRLGQLQIAAGGPVQLHIASAVEHVQAADVVHVAFLRLGDVGQQRPRGADGGALLAQTALVHVGKAELAAQADGGAQIFKAVAAALDHGVQLLLQEADDGALVLGAVGEDGLPRGEAAQLVDDMVDGVVFKAGAAELAGGDVAEGDAAAAALQVDGAEVVAAPLLQHGAVGDGAGGDDAHHVPGHQALGQGGVLGLLADGHLVAPGDQPGDVGLGAVVGHAAHGGAFLGVGDAAVPGGQRQIQLPRGDLGVFVEHLIKIAEAEEEQTVPVLLLDLVVLPLHRREFSHRFSPFLFFSLRGSVSEYPRIRRKSFV